MSIEKIKCPRLNKSYRNNIPGGEASTPHLEVFVRFFDEAPVRIMCDKYNLQSKLCDINKKDCTYESWKLILNSSTFP